MDYLDKIQVVPHLEKTNVVEQFLRHRNEDGGGILQFIRIEKDKFGNFVLSAHEVFDEGTPDFLDIYEFTSMDPDNPFGVFFEFETAAAAVEHACEKLNARYDHFVANGMVQVAYKEIVHPDW